MPLPSFLKRATPRSEEMGVTKPDPAALVQARRRLIGAAVLLALGVIIFPWLFESKPRPLPTDVPLVYAPTALRPLEGPSPGTAAPGRAGAAAPAGSGPAGALAKNPKSPSMSGTPAAPSGEAGDADHRTAEGGVASTGPSDGPVVEEPAAPAVDAPPAAKVSDTALSSASPRPADAPVPKPPARRDTPAGKPGGDPAGMSGTPAPAKASVATRYIVQVGAFADPAAARQVRLKVERLGLVTYTHVIDVPGGQRIRVRVGPMTDRAQAQRALDKIRQAGLTGDLLML